MKATGIVRKIDELGRIVLPMELRKAIGIDSPVAMEIFADDDKKTIMLRQYIPADADIFTGVTTDIVKYEGKCVSKQSIKKLCDLAGFICIDPSEDIDIFTGKEAENLIEYNGIKVSEGTVKELSKAAGLI